MTASARKQPTYWKFSDYDENVVPFPSARNAREVRRAAAAIIAGRSPGVAGWIDKQARWLVKARVPKDLAEHDIRQLEAAINLEIEWLIEGGAHG